MFGFGNRKIFNASVDTRLIHEYQIATQDNPKLGGPFAYLGLIDNAWNAKMSEGEAALYIATLYYCGILKHGHFEEATALVGRIRSIAAHGVQQGRISEQRWSKFSTAIEDASANIKALEAAQLLGNTDGGSHLSS